MSPLSTFFWVFGVVLSLVGASGLTYVALKWWHDGGGV